eukprot:gene7360-biopygen8815
MTGRYRKRSWGRLGKSGKAPNGSGIQGSRNAKSRRVRECPGRSGKVRNGPGTLGEDSFDRNTKSGRVRALGPEHKVRERHGAIRDNPGKPRMVLGL